MTNYICINGKKAELTEEQMKALGIELPKVNPFAKHVNNEVDVYFINSMGVIQKAWDIHNCLYNVANYCTDKSLMEQRALHETLNRLLWRYSMEHDGDKIDFRLYVNTYKVARYRTNGKFFVECNDAIKDICTVYFYTKEIALGAIEEIIKPFMKAHPEFKW